eukprot:2440313-Alexandrium_andersonii.AAC.1
MCKVQGSLLTWATVKGDCAHPRKEGSKEFDLVLTGPPEQRAYALRNARRRATWYEWRHGSRRYDAGLARACNAEWQP